MAWGQKMRTKLVDFFRWWYNNFVPIWKWEIPKRKRKPQYREILKKCRTVQIVLAILLCLCALASQRSREVLDIAIARDGFIYLGSEASVWIFLGYVLGSKRIPANYISLVIIRTFIVLEKELGVEVRNFELKLLRESSSRGYWSVLTYNSKPVTFTAEHPVIRNTSLLLIGISAMAVITKFTKIDISKEENTAVILASAGCSSAAALLVTSHQIADWKEYPQVQEWHRTCCELWMLFAAFTFVFMLIFLFQRLRRIVRGEIKVTKTMRLIWECAIFFLTLHIMTHFLPVIHKGFSTRDLLSSKSMQDMAIKLIPSHFRSIVRASPIYMQRISERTAEMYGGHMKKGSY